MRPIPIRDIVNYLRLEEHEGTADLLLPASLCNLGMHDGPTGPTRYWSYPTIEGVAWVELDAAGSLGICDEVPASVRAATPARSAHRMRPPSTRASAPSVAKRIKPAQAVWVALNELPACDYHAAWYEQTSFDDAVRYYRAKAVKDRSTGVPARLFYVQLTSGRYACIESREGFPKTVIISLEVDTRRAGKNSGGKVHVRDIEEILQPMGGRFTMPTANLYIGWSAED